MHSRTASVVLATLVTLAALVAPRDEIAARPAASTASARCVRDTASDLRWVSWIHRVHTGADPAMTVAARWLADISDGKTYEEVARSIARTDGAVSAAVARIYGIVLGRTPSAGEVAGWVPTMRAQGSATVARSFLASGELFARGGSTNEGWLDVVYPVVLGRAPDRAGRAYWAARLAAGTPRDAVAAALWASTTSVRRRVDRSYRLVLGRPGDPGGIDFWSTVAIARGDEALDAALASTGAGWALAQQTYGAPATPMPAPCPPIARWVPPAGTLVRSLPAIQGTGPLVAALTFDDGPSSRWTPQILDILARHDVPATFFVVGNMARANPDLVRRQVAEGHHVGVHTMTHPVLPLLSASAQQREIAGSVDVVDSIVGPGHVRCFRPPYGSRNATTDRISADLGLATVLWSRDGRDWASPGVDQIVQGNLDTRYDGGRAVLLLHDGGLQRAQTVAALPRLIDALRARGYQFVQIC